MTRSRLVKLLRAVVAPVGLTARRTPRDPKREPRVRVEGQLERAGGAVDVDHAHRVGLRDHLVVGRGGESTVCLVEHDRRVVGRKLLEFAADIREADAARHERRIARAVHREHLAFDSADH
eukprot:747831-Prymnesium_polylepis.1